jgi:hypothetical protein
MVVESGTLGAFAVDVAALSGSSKQKNFWRPFLHWNGRSSLIFSYFWCGSISLHLLLGFLED